MSDSKKKAAKKSTKPRVVAAPIAPPVPVVADEPVADKGKGKRWRTSPGTNKQIGARFDAEIVSRLERAADALNANAKANADADALSRSSHNAASVVKMLVIRGLAILEGEIERGAKARAGKK